MGEGNALGEEKAAALAEEGLGKFGADGELVEVYQTHRKQFPLCQKSLNIRPCRYR